MKYLLVEYENKQADESYYIEWDDDTECLSVSSHKDENYLDFKENSKAILSIGRFVIERFEHIIKYKEDPIGRIRPWELDFPFVLKFYEECMTQLRLSGAM